jgi:hypothetical protein
MQQKARAALPIPIQRGDEGLLRDVHAAELAHLLLAVPLAEAFAHARCITF